jgi:hypothetical protein
MDARPAEGGGATGSLGGNLAVPVPAGATVTKEVTFKVPMGALPGAYTFTVNLAHGLAPTVAIVNVT